MNEIFVGVAILEFLCGFNVPPAILVAFLKICSLVAVLFVHNIELFHEEVVFLLKLEELGPDLGLKGFLVGGMAVFELFSFEEV